MAKKTQAQIEFKAVTAGFDNGIKSMDQSLTTLRKELKLNSTELKGNADDVDLLTKRKEILQEESEASAKKVELLTKKLNEAEKIFGENSNEVRLLNNQLLEAKNVYQGIQNEVIQTNAKLSKFGSEASETASDLDKLTNEINQQEKRLNDLRTEYTNVVLAQGKNSKEAKELKSAMNTLNTELNENKTKLTQAENASKKFTTSLKKTDSASDNADGGFTVLKGTIADLASNVISSAVSAIGNLIGSLLDLGEATEEYRSMQAKLSGTSDRTGYSIDFVNGKYEEFYRYLGDDQMATNAITNLVGIGTSTDSLSSIANGAIGVWASYGDSIPIESLTEAINETIQVGKVTGTFADTINWTIDAEEKLYDSLEGNSKAQKVFNKAIKDGETAEDAYSLALAKVSSQQERADIVAKFLNDTYGESKEKYDDMTGSIQDANSAELDLKETQAQIAETLAPVNSAFAELKNESLEAMLPVIKAVSEAFMELKGWLDEHPVACDILKTVLTTLTAVIVTLTAVVVGWTVAQWALNSAILANPITWIIVGIVAAITAVIAIIVIVIKYWDQIVEAVKNCVDFVVQKWNEFVSWIDTNVIQPVKQFFSDLWNDIIEKATNLWIAVKIAWSIFKDWINNTFIQPIIGFFQGLWEGIKSIWDGICNVVQFAIMLIASIIDAAFQIITLPFRFIWENCKDTIISVWESIKSAVSTAINFVKDIITTVTSAISNFLKTVWNGIKTIVSTAWNYIVNHITTRINLIKTVVTTVFNIIKNTVTTIFNAIKSFVTTIWNAIKTAISTAINAIKEVVTNVFNAVKEKVTSIFNSVKNTVTSVWNNIKSSVSNAVNGVKNTVSNVFDSVKSKVTSVWNGIKSAIETPINKAKETVKNVVESIKGFFSGMKLKLPDIKMPHFKVTGKFSLDPPSVPKLSIDWYKDGGIFAQPTIFNTRNGLKGVGEAGAEAVLPLQKLEDWMNSGFNRVTNNNYYNSEKIERLIEVAEEILAKPTDIYIDKNRLGGAMAETNDVYSGQRVNFKNRGVIM